MKKWRKLTVFGMYDYYLRLLYALSKYVYHIQCKHTIWMLCHCLWFVLFIVIHTSSGTGHCDNGLCLSAHALYQSEIVTDF